MTQGAGEARADGKNYYGRQIEQQKKETKSEVVSPPKYRGAKADPYRPDSVDDDPKGSADQPADARSHQTETSNKTQKLAANEYYEGLTDKVMNLYDESSGSRPRTSGDEENRMVSAHVGSPDAVQEERAAPAEVPDPRGRRATRRQPAVAPAR